MNNCITSIVKRAKATAYRAGRTTPLESPAAPAAPVEPPEGRQLMSVMTTGVGSPAYTNISTATVVVTPPAPNRFSPRIWGRG